jgi:5'-nucleotidase
LRSYFVDRAYLQELRFRHQYRVSSRFLADGGDAFPLFREGTERVDGVADVDALKNYLIANSPLSPVVPARIRVLP